MADEIVIINITEAPDEPVTINVTEPPAEPVQIFVSDLDSVPKGGTPGQLLSKASGTDYHTRWVDAPVVNVGANRVAFGAPGTGELTGSANMLFVDQVSGFDNRAYLTVAGTLIGNIAGYSIVRATQHVSDGDMEINAANGAMYFYTGAGSLRGVIDQVSGAWKILPGSVASDNMLRVDTIGVRVGPRSSMNTSNIYPFEVGGTVAPSIYTSVLGREVYMAWGTVGVGYDSGSGQCGYIQGFTNHFKVLGFNSYSYLNLKHLGGASTEIEYSANNHNLYGTVQINDSGNKVFKSVSNGIEVGSGAMLQKIILNGYFSSIDFTGPGADNNPCRISTGADGEMNFQTYYLGIGDFIFRPKYIETFRITTLGTVYTNGSYTSEIRPTVNGLEFIPNSGGAGNRGVYFSGGNNSDNWLSNSGWSQSHAWYSSGGVTGPYIRYTNCSSTPVDDGKIAFYSTTQGSVGTYKMLVHGGGVNFGNAGSYINVNGFAFSSTGHLQFLANSGGSLVIGEASSVNDYYNPNGHDIRGGRLQVSTNVFISAAGAPLWIDSTNGNSAKIVMKDLGIHRSSFGCDSTYLFTILDNGGNIMVAINPDKTFRTMYGLMIDSVSEYADNTAAALAGLPVGMLFRTGDILKIRH